MKQISTARNAIALPSLMTVFGQKLSKMAKIAIFSEKLAKNPLKIPYLFVNFYVFPGGPPGIGENRQFWGKNRVNFDPILGTQLWQPIPSK